MNPFYMVRLFFRMLMRRKLFSSINIIGLAFGIAFILLIGQYLYFEFSYNRSFENIDHIYRLVDAADKYYGIDYRARDAIVDNIPAVKNAGLLLNRRSIEVNQADQVYELGSISLVDPGFFEIFKFPFVFGEPQSALSTVEAVVLTESIARRIFGRIDVLGQTLILEHQYEMVVTGVVRDLPQNISFRTDLFASAENTKSKRISYAMDCLTYDGVDDSQCKYPYNIFVELQDHADPATVAQQVPGLFNLDDYRFPNEVSLTPLKTNYFNTQYPDGDLAHGNLSLVKILSWIGLIILALAVINFVNLTTAGYKYRLTEIGVKKCFGVSKRSLQKQLLFESFLICLCAALLGILIAEIFLPYFNQYVDKPLHIQIFTNLNFSLLFILFVVFLSVFAGLVPAVILAKISPLQVFQLGSYMQGSGKAYRHILSVFQFGVTIALICSLLVMSKQIDYVKHKELGFETEQLLSLRVHHRIGEKTQLLMHRLRQYHGMKSLTFTNGIPGKISMSMGGFKTIIVDSSTMKTFGFKIVQGRDLLPGDLNKTCLINTEGLAKFEDGDFQGHEVNGSEVVGVVSDFHYDSMHKKTEALALMYYDWGGSHITMRISGPVDEAMNYIRVAWKEICPDYPIELQFYDDAFAAMYQKEDRLATLITIFSVLAVVISCMGIFGLAVFQSEQRVKEIGVRKVLGARAAEITTMLTKNFIKWVIVANVVAWPLAYYAMHNWLQNFAYRIEMDWWMFALSGTIAVTIALLTISWQAIRAATANPVESLRYE